MHESHEEFMRTLGDDLKVVACFGGLLWGNSGQQKLRDYDYLVRLANIVQEEHSKVVVLAHINCDHISFESLDTGRFLLETTSAEIVLFIASRKLGNGYFHSMEFSLNNDGLNFLSHWPNLNGRDTFLSIIDRAREFNDKLNQK